MRRFSEEAKVQALGALAKFSSLRQDFPNSSVLGEVSDICVGIQSCDIRKCTDPVVLGSVTPTMVFADIGKLIPQVQKQTSTLYTGLVDALHRAAWVLYLDLVSAFPDSENEYLDVTESHISKLLQDVKSDPSLMQQLNAVRTQARQAQAPRSNVADQQGENSTSSSLMNMLSQAWEQRTEQAAPSHPQGAATTSRPAEARTGHAANQASDTEQKPKKKGGCSIQ